MYVARQMPWMKYQIQIAVNVLEIVLGEIKKLAATSRQPITDNERFCGASDSCSDMTEMSSSGTAGTSTTVWMDEEGEDIVDRK